MARGAKTETFGNEAVRLDDIFVAQPISRMRHLQLSYTHKSAVAPEERKRKGKRNKLHVEGFAPQLADKDIRSQIEEGGEWDEELTYRDFVRLICLKDKIKGKKAALYC